MREKFRIENNTAVLKVDKGKKSILVILNNPSAENLKVEVLDGEDSAVVKLLD